MRQLFSTMYATANENEAEEIQLDYYRSGIEMLLAFLKTFETQDPRVTETFVYDGRRWINKDTGEIPNHDKQFELFEIKARMNHRSMFEDSFAGEF